MEEAVTLSAQRKLNRKEFFKLEVKEDSLIPGSLAVKVYDGGAIKELKNREIKFFGVQEKGRLPTGTGVRPERKKYIERQAAVFWFRIEQLINNNQFTEGTEEVILTADNEEIGRDVLVPWSVIHLG